MLLEVNHAVFLPGMKHFNVLTVPCDEAYSTCDNVKTMAGGHTVQAWQ